MRCGTIPAEQIPGGIDLGATLESGQSYLWRRRQGEMYASDSPPDGVWYETVIDGAYLRVRQRNGGLEWASTADSEDRLRVLLRLDDDLHRIKADSPGHPLVERAWQAYWGMRLVQDPVFPCLISFICSTQMRVPRIQAMQRRLAATFGEPVEIDGECHHGFPDPETLATVPESRLRELSLGYRAPYVKATAEQVADRLDPAAAADLPYEAAREYLTQFTGVGPKVADCVLLFSLGFTQAVPLDTWIKRAIAAEYPDCDRGDYGATSAAIRERFGSRYAGYVQTYAFHYLRHHRPDI